MPNRGYREEYDDRPIRRRRRKKGGSGAILWVIPALAVPVLIALVVLGAFLLRGRLPIGGGVFAGGGDSPTDVVQKLVQAAERKDWSAAFDLLAPETQKRISEGIRDWMRSVPSARPYASGDDRAVYVKMCKEQDRLDWPNHITPGTEVLSEKIDGDRAVVTVRSGKDTPQETKCVKIGGRWYVTDR